MPIGSRVPTKNPNRFEVDPQPEPDQATWAKLSITGTTIHPVWSVDRQDVAPIAELAEGERLSCDTESFGLGFPSSL